MNRALLLFLAAFALGSPLHAPAQALSEGSVFPHLQNDPLFDQGTYQDLHDVSIDAGWNQVPLKTVLRDMALLTIKAYPIAAAIDFRFNSAATPADRQRLVSIPKGRMPVFTILQNLAVQASFTIKVHSNLVFVEPRPGR